MQPFWQPMQAETLMPPVRPLCDLELQVHVESKDDAHHTPDNWWSSGSSVSLKSEMSC